MSPRLEPGKLLYKRDNTKSTGRSLNKSRSWHWYVRHDKCLPAIVGRRDRLVNRRLPQKESVHKHRGDLDDPSGMARLNVEEVENRFRPANTISMNWVKSSANTLPFLGD